MNTLHIFRSEPDEEVRELIRAVTEGGAAGKELGLYEGPIDYGKLLGEILAHDRVICWW